MDYLRDKMRQVYTDVVQTISSSPQKMDLLKDRINQYYSEALKGKQPGSPREADLDELRTIFGQFDLDGDGFIDEDEMKQVLRTMDKNATEQQIHAMFQSADLNGDGKITFDEFVHVSNANPVTMSYKRVFQELDTDGDGEITKPELKDGFASMGQHLTDTEIDVIFRQADRNKDGKINFDEFVCMMGNKK